MNPIDSLLTQFETAVRVYERTVVEAGRVCREHELNYQNVILPAKKAQHDAGRKVDALKADIIRLVQPKDLPF